jgi:acyl-CoA thioester hydrolase
MTHMAYEYQVQRVVEFSETDMAGIVHFTNFFRYMEQAEHAFYRSLGMSVMMEDSGRTISWPRVSASCDYKKPLRFEDIFEIRMSVKEKRTKSIVYQFEFYKIESKAGPLAEPEVVAVGELAVVCVQKDGDGGMKSIEIPTAISGLIDVAPA